VNDSDHWDREREIMNKSSVDVASSTPIVVRFRSDMRDVRARRLWQRLFDFYRENQCPLGHMDNMLIDLQNCVEVMEATLTTIEPVRFLWGCDTGHNMTTWINERSWKDISIETCMKISGFDFFVLCEVTKDEARFQVKST
jgi:hypothetical protein